MAKRRTRLHVQRDRYLIANDPLLYTPVHPVSDLRSWHPERQWRPPLDISGRRTRVTLVPGTSPGPSFHAPTPARKAPARFSGRSFVPRPGREVWAFTAPKKALVCVRRRIRRSVLLALKPRYGFGKRRRNHYSNVRC